MNVKHMWTACIPRGAEQSQAVSQQEEKSGLPDKNLSKLLLCANLKQCMHVCGYANMHVGQNMRGGLGVQSRDVTKAGSA